MCDVNTRENIGNALKIWIGFCDMNLFFLSSTNKPKEDEQCEKIFIQTTAVHNTIYVD